MAVALSRGKKGAKNAYSRKSVKPQKPTLNPGNGLLSFVKWIFTMLLSVSLLVGISIGLLYVYRYATSSEYFAVKSIEVSGNLRLRQEEILALAGVAPGSNSLAVNIADMESGLLRNPWITEVSVKRLLPDGFAIKVAEREPKFWVQRGGELLYADEHGNIIAPVGAGRFTSLPTLEVETGAEEALERLPEITGDLKRARLPVDIALVSWVRLSPGKGVELYLENSDLRLSIALEDWRENLDRLGKVLDDLARRGELKQVREVKAGGVNVWVQKDAALGG